MVSFQTKNSQFGYIVVDLGMENVDILVIWNSLRPLGIFYGHLIILQSFGIRFPIFGISYEEKSGSRAREVQEMFSKSQKVI
jgi:hypothetical protein